MLRHFNYAIVGAALSLAACVQPVEVVQPLAEAQRGQVEVVDVEVSLTQTAGERMQKFDEKAAKTRTDEGLPVWTEGMQKPEREHYETLPFQTMFAYMVEDVLQERGVMGPEKVRLNVEIDTLKTANAAMMWLAGDSDQLAGMVSVHDVDSNVKLAEFYVDTTNSNAGLLGIAIRGGGVREKLTAEFAGHVAKQLTVQN